MTGKERGKFSTSEKLIKPCDRQQARENKAPVKSARKNVTNENSGKKYNRLVHYILGAYFVIFLQYRIVRDDNRLQPFLKYRKDLSLNEKTK